MVSGTQWPGGDPFLQRQNEPSLAISSRNTLHLLAGANDYRTVDLPVSDTVPGSLAGDAWLGVFKSRDGGQTWQSYLLPGYPQDQSPQGLASPLKAFSGAADPTVRAGTDALYYSGIAFNRGTNNGAVFVSTFFDANRKENGDATQGLDTIQYQNTVVVDTGTSGQFLDKTWLAVDIPRAGAGTCTFNAFGASETVRAGNVYLVWSRFTGSASTKIMFSRSLDCGKTWSNPIKLSESSSINQGTNIGIEAKLGTVYVAWRQFATSSNPDSILVAQSNDFGKTFPSKNTVQVATIAPFDQSTTTTRIRTNALPSIATSVDANGKSRVHVAWAQRNSVSQDAQIVVSSSSDGLKWSAPVPIDAGPVFDDSGNSFFRGHQFMPQITFADGRLMVVYYDQKLDHTLGLFQPNQPFLPDAQGKFYLRTQMLKGELVNPGGTTGQNQIFTLGFDDSLLTARRHTIDLRVAEALPSASPSFTSASVSQYRTGLWAAGADGVFRDDEGQAIPLDANGDPKYLHQLQVNVPNLPLFSQGTVPFLGDYIDIAGQTFKANGDGTWSFNTSLSGAPVFYAAWTDNRDVIPPIDPLTHQVDWTKYTPPVSSTNAGDGTSTSILDPTQNVPACQGPFTGSRNQNIYSSRITEGLLVSSPQDAKPLSPTLQRAFVITMQNLTPQERTFTMTLSAPQNVQASFLQTSSAASLSVTIAARSGAARPVFATSSNPAGRITVNVVESGTNSIGLAGSIVLNAEGSVSPLAQPDGTTADIGSLEIYTPAIQVWNQSNPNPFLNIGNPNLDISATNTVISNPDPAILNIGNLNIGNLNIGNLNIGNPSPAVLNIGNLNIGNTTAANLNIGNLNIGNLNIGNLNIGNLNIGNSPVSDATYAVTNTGNTTHSYKVALYGNNSNSTPLQLIVTKNSTTPTAVGCTLQSVPQGTVLARADNPAVSATLSDATNPDILGASNATVPIGPGETIFVTLRGATGQMAQLTQQLTPVITAHGANTNGVTEFAALLLIQAGNGGNLPVAVVGSPYSTTLQATGGKAPLTWSLFSGSLPGGLTLSTAGVISGTPSAGGVFTFTVKVSDSSSPVQQTATQSFTLTVNARATATAVSVSPNPLAVGQAGTVSVMVTDVDAAGTKSSPAGTVLLSSSAAGDTFGPAASCTLAPSGSAASSCSATLTASSSGARIVSASYSGSSVHSPSGSTTPLIVRANTTTTITSDTPDPSVVGQAVNVAVLVSPVAPASGVPTGSLSVTVNDGSGSSCTATLSGGGASCALTLSVVGTWTITATYSGDGLDNSSAGTAAHQVNPVPFFYNFIGFLTPLSTAGTLDSPSSSGTGNFTKGLPIKWQLKDSSGHFVTSLTSTQVLQATYYVGGVCTSGQATGTSSLLYSPTSGAAGGSTFRYDATNNQFLFNWSTKAVTTGPGCYEIILQLNDGSTPKATQVNLQ